eukprot:TRINITY_DN4042_c0_g1_i2.p1 TRINITY_DN4042_c0_g1~~TRINITY_DN4042_c0_g1_i2.p1  ORF type:complete len:339 (-),score=48.01 TRINITY_DN4042_c0_g1_i2:329-1315(-)
MAGEGAVSTSQECQSYHGGHLMMHREMEGNYTKLKKSRLSGSSYKRNKEALSRLCLESLPRCLNEKVCQGLQDLDKIFASLWFNPNYVVTGTKNNKLLVWDVTRYPYCHRTIELPKTPTPLPPSNCGIHSLAVNPSETYLASGSDNPSEIALFELPTFKPVVVLTGHEDWSFCCSFVGEDRVISGSRDRTVCLWSVARVSSNEGTTLREPLITKVEHQGKVRALVVAHKRKYFSTLGVEGTIKYWDQERFEVTNTVPVPETPELVCMALNEDIGLSAVGSQTLVSFFDEKSGTNTFVQKSINDDWGNLLMIQTARQMFLLSRGPVAYF